MVKITLGVVAVCLGLGLITITALSMIDPVGSQMADDGNPFGPAIGTWRQDLTFTLISLGLVIGGGALVSSGARDQRSTAKHAG